MAENFLWISDPTGTRRAMLDSFVELIYTRRVNAPGVVAWTVNGEHPILAVDDTKVGNRVPQFYRRQGGDANNWSTPGTTTYVPGATRIQAGSAYLAVINGTAQGTIVFPVAFSQPPVVINVIPIDLVTPSLTFEVIAVSATGITVNVTASAGPLSQQFHWSVIGPE